MQEGRIVFVTFELYPLTAGGIGRAIYNIIDAMPIEDRVRTTVVVVGDYRHVPKTPLSLEGIDIVFADLNDESGLTDGEATFPPRWAFAETDWHWRSFVAMRCLFGIQKKHSISYVEFTDWGGLAYCTVQEKIANSAFQDTCIAVRLHGPHGVLLHTEQYSVTENDISIFELERKSLRDCDLVITQTTPYAAKVRDIFGLDVGEWNSKLFFSPPPVSVDFPFSNAWSPKYGAKRVIFTSKFQHIKRPEVFVRGAAQFLASKTGLGWSAVFCAHVTDSAAKERVIAQIPAEVAHRFTFEQNLHAAERDRLISNSVVVISSKCESFCLAAYEASLLGALVVVNASNPSFGEDTLWKDSLNCIKYDGTAAGLYEALCRCASLNKPLSRIELPPFARAWATLPKSNGLTKKLGSPKVSIVIFGAEDGEKLARTMRNVASSTYRNFELVVVTAGVGSETLILLQDQIKAMCDKDIRLFENASDNSIGASLNAAMSNLSSEFVAFVQAGDLIHDAFIERALSALSQNEHISSVGAHVGFFDPSSPPETSKSATFVRYKAIVGEVPVSGYIDDRWSGSPVVYRTKNLGSKCFAEELNSNLWWAFHARQLQSDSRSLTLNRTFVFRDITAADEVSSNRWDKALAYHNLLQEIFEGPAVPKAHYLLWSYLRGRLFQLEYDHTQASAPIVSSPLAELDDIPEGRSHRQEANRLALDHILEEAEPRIYDASRNLGVLFLRRWRKRHRNYDIIRRSGAFDDNWYTTQYPDVARAGIDALEHFLKLGAAEGRWPNPYFDPYAYLVANPDVRQAGINPLLHYILYGRKERRNLQ